MRLLCRKQTRRPDAPLVLRLPAETAAALQEPLVVEELAQLLGAWAVDWAYDHRAVAWPRYVAEHAMAWLVARSVIEDRPESDRSPAALLAAEIDRRIRAGETPSPA